MKVSFLLARLLLAAAPIFGASNASAAPFEFSFVTTLDASAAAATSFGASATWTFKVDNGGSSASGQVFKLADITSVSVATTIHWTNDGAPWTNTWIAPWMRTSGTDYSFNKDVGFISTSQAGVPTLLVDAAASDIGFFYAETPNYFNTLYGEAWGYDTIRINISNSEYFPSSFALTDSGYGASVIYPLGPGQVTALAPVPEPNTYAMMMVGLVLLGAVARRTARQGQAKVPHLPGSEGADS